MNAINDDELQFVARHYKADSLNADRAWKRFSMTTGRGTLRVSPPARRLGPATRRIAASVGIALIVSASVACGFWYARQQADSSPLPPTSSLNTPYRYLQPRAESIVLKYDNAPIDDVLSELSDYYGRELALKTAPRRRISGEIEATSLEEVVEVLEATLDIKIEMK